MLDSGGKSLDKKLYKKLYKKLDSHIKSIGNNLFLLIEKNEIEPTNRHFNKKLNILEQKINKLDSFDTKKAIVSEYNNMKKVRKKYQENKTTKRLDKYKELLGKGIIFSDSLENEFNSVYQNLQKSNSLEDFLVKATPFVEIIMKMRVSDIEKVSKIFHDLDIKYYKESEKKGEGGFLEKDVEDENKIWVYDKISEEKETNGIVVPINSIELHVLKSYHISSGTKIKAFLSLPKLLNKYMKSHEDCVGVLMESWLLHEMEKRKKDKRSKNKKHENLLEKLVPKGKKIISSKGRGGIYLDRKEVLNMIGEGR